MSKINIYIDGNNLYRSAKELGFEIDYKKFRGWLRQKYNPTSVYIFIGLIPVEFLKENSSIDRIVAPDEQKCSILLRNKNTEITFLNEHYHKFSTTT